MKPKKILVNIETGIIEEIELTDAEYQQFLDEQNNAESVEING
jgi:hypothetical protein